MSEPTSSPAPAAPSVFVAFPTYNRLNRLDVMQAVFHQACKHRPIRFGTGKCSLLAMNFNSLFCDAVNSGCTHFAMVHADVQPAPLWLDTLLAEMEAQDCDVLSVVLPIKHAEGLTSTAIDDPTSPWEPWYRLSMHEIHALPETFSGRDVGYPDNALLVNTGCMLVRLGGWVADFPGFTVRDRIVKEDGKYVAQTEPEDWAFSRWCHAHGLRVLATRLVQAHHWGDEQCFANYTAWGTAQTDPGCGRARAGQVPTPAPEVNGMVLEGAELL